MSNRYDMGKLIARTRKELGYTQQQMAEKTGIHKTVLSRMENGHFTGALYMYECYIDAVGLEMELVPKQHKLPDWDDIEDLFSEDD